MLDAIEISSLAQVFMFCRRITIYLMYDSGPVYWHDYVRGLEAWDTHEKGAFFWIPDEIVANYAFLMLLLTKFNLFLLAQGNALD